jgi:EAL domain-containing protein (putative c-di-GMP-specific phosphodiesterase class I)/GGDEF domain-containing protein
MTLLTTKNPIFFIFWMISLLSPDLLAFETSAALNNPINQFWVISDPSHDVTPKDIANQKDSDWTEYSSPDFNLGYTPDTVWIKIILTNSLDQDIIRVLDITYPLLDSVILYKLSSQQRLDQIMISGDSLVFSRKNIAHPNHIDLLNLKANSTNTFFIKIQSNSPIQTQFLIWDINKFQQHYRSLAGFDFIYLGLILSIVIFNLFVFLFLRESIYLYYTIYAAFFALFMASQNGILLEYIYPDYPSIHNWSQLIFAAGTTSFTAIFNRSFLKMHGQSLSNRALSIFAITPLFIVIASPLIGYSIAIQVMVVFALVTVPACFAIGIQQSKNRQDQTLYILAWSWLIIGVITFLLLKLGLVPFNTFTTHSIQIGSALELITFSIALARRIHTERETRMRAQEIIIDSSRKTALLHKDLLYTATHDPVTAMPNLVAFESWIDEQIQSLTPFSIVYLRLSRINDIDKTLGRKFSEQALKVFSERLNSSLKNIDGFMAIDAREKIYAATLNQNTHGMLITKSEEEGLEDILSSLQQSLDTPLYITDMEIEPYLTLSYASYPEDGEDAASLLRHSDIAIDHANSGEQSIVKYETKIDPYNERRLNLMGDLNRAIFSDKLSLHFQPLVDTKTSDIIGAEALVRWPHEEYGLIMPDQFIHTAEQTGVIQALSLWVLKNAIKQQPKWTSSHPDFLLSVNISAYNLQDKKFIEAVNILFSEHKNLAKNIILEITETQMMSDTQHALKNLWQLSELGFHIAIDDFGTGYSNLAYLKKLPASELKIDKTFILNLESDKQNQVLVQTAIHMAHNLGLKVVAEGVESERARAILSDMGCDMCQGFHFSRPVPAEQFDKLLSSKAINKS